MTDRFRMLANAATAANAVLGAGAIAYILLGNPLFAMLLIAIGLGFDGLDGLLSRRSSRSGGVAGRLADSIADAITFGVAPALLIGFHGGQGPPWGPLVFAAAAVGVFYGALAIGRLVYFTLNSYRHEHFVGVPTPQSALAVSLFALWWYVPALAGVAAIPFLVAASVVAVLMIVPLPFPKIRRGSALRLPATMTAIAAAVALVVLQFRPDPGTIAYVGASVATGFFAIGVFAYYLLGPFTTAALPGRGRSGGDRS